MDLSMRYPKRVSVVSIGNSFRTKTKNQQAKSIFETTKQRHCVKSVQIRSYFWSVFSCIQSEHRKIRTRNNSVFGHFSRTEKRTGDNNFKTTIRQSLTFIFILSKNRTTKLEKTNSREAYLNIKVADISFS